MIARAGPLRNGDQLFCALVNGLGLLYILKSMAKFQDVAWRRSVPENGPGSDTKDVSVEADTAIRLLDQKPRVAKRYRFSSFGDGGSWLGKQYAFSTNSVSE